MSFQKTSSLVILFSILTAFFLSGCGSSAVKMRKEERNKLSQSSKMYCEFINGEVYANDVEVALNIDMAKRCDSEKPFSIAPYKTPSESQGIIYCCSTTGRGSVAKAAAPAPAPAAKKDDSKAAEVDEVE